MDIENMLPGQLASDPPLETKIDMKLRDLAQLAHSEARQRVDLRRDLAQKLRPSDGPFLPGQGV